MRTLRLSVPILCLCLLSLSSLNGANLVFVFHSSSTTCSIYDADSLTLAGTPTVGTGAVKAFGVPDINNPGQFLRFLVVTSSSVVALSPTAPFAVQGTLTLSGSLASTPNSAVLSPDGTWLLVAAGSQVQVVNATGSSVSFAANITMNSAPSSLALLPTGRRAYVLSSGSPIIQMIELNTTSPFLLSTPVNLPGGSFPTAIGIAPNGSRLYVASPTPPTVYEIDRFNNTVLATIPNLFFSGVSSITFDPDPPVSSAVLNGGSGAPVLMLATRGVGGNPFFASGLSIGKIVLPGLNRAFLLAGSPARLYQGFVSAGGAVSEVINPTTGISFGPNAVDMEASPDGSRLFVAFSDFRVMRIDPSGFATPGQILPSISPTGLSLVYPPATQASLLEIYGGNNQAGTASTFFTIPLAVRARAGGPAFRQTVNFTSSTSGVTFSDSNPVTNLQGVAETFVQVPTASALQVQATIIAGGFASPVTFNLNSGGAGNPGGLSKVSGDKQVALQSTPFPAPLIVQGFAGETFSVSVPTGLATCTSPVAADVNGQATITCSANAVSADTSIDISVSDATTGATLADPFHATIVKLAADLPTSLHIETQPAPLVGAVRQTLQNALMITATKANGALVSDVGVEFTKPDDVTISPPTVVTGSSPVSASVTLGCSRSAGAITARLLAPNVQPQTIGFTTTPGPVAQVNKKQGDNQRGNPGQRLPQALLIQVTDVCGNPLSQQSITWSVNSPSATFESVIATTDFEGKASVLVRLSPTASGVITVTATTSGGVSAAFTLTVNVQPTRLLLISGNNQSVVLGQALAQPLVVEVQDESGNSVAGIDVVFNLTSGSATLGANRATTDSRGRAQTTVTAGSTLGTITVVATAISRTVTFTITTVGRVPNVTTLGFVNSASFRVGWVPGSGGTIFGSGLMDGVSGVVTSGTAPFPTTLRGVRITVEGIDAPLIALININGQEQINLQVPVGIPTGTVTVVLSNNGSTTTIPGVRVVAIQPAIFEFDSGGTRLAAALHLDFSVVTQQNPARPGEIILLFLTGLGATTPPIQTNVAGPANPVAVTITKPVVGINDGGAEVLGTFYAPGLYTAYQINFVVPLNAPAGLIKISVIADGNASQDSRIPIGPPR